MLIATLHPHSETRFLDGNTEQANDVNCDKETPHHPLIRARGLTVCKCALFLPGSRSQ